MESVINLSRSNSKDLERSIEDLANGGAVLPFTLSSVDSDLIKLLLRSSSNYPDAMKSDVSPASSPAAYALMHELAGRFIQYSHTVIVISMVI